MPMCRYEVKFERKFRSLEYPKNVLPPEADNPSIEPGIVMISLLVSAERYYRAVVGPANGFRHALLSLLRVNFEGPFHLS